MKTRLIVPILTLSIATGCGLLKKDKKDDSATTETSSGSGSGGSGGTASDKPQNAAGCALPEGELKGSVTLKKGCTVKVTANVLIVENGTLTIEPGVKVLMSQGTYLQVVEGKIVAKGTEKEPITFTSANSTKAPGDWSAIFLQDKTSAGTEFEHVKFEYGGGSGSDAHAALDIRDQHSSGRIAVTNCTFEENDQAGIINDNAKGGFSRFSGNKFKKNKYSLVAHSRVLGTVGAGNVFTDPLVTHGDVDEDTTWPAFGVPVIVDESVHITAEKMAPKLTIAPQTTLKFAGGKYLTVGEGNGGSLVAENVTFTSSNASPHAGDWPGIFLYKRASVVNLKGSTVEYAGEGSLAEGAITVYEGNAKDLKGLTAAGMIFKNSAHAAISSEDHDCSPFTGAKSEGAPLCKKD
jgi:hypothetical protein